MKKETSNIIVLIFLLSNVNCQKTDSNKLGGIDIGIFLKAIEIEKIIGLDALESSKISIIRICKLETMGNDVKAIDCMVQIEMADSQILFSVWNVSKNTIQKNSRFILKGVNYKEFVYVIDEIKPYLLNSEHNINSFDGKEHFVLSFMYRHYNRYYYGFNDNNINTKQYKFIQYIKNTIAKNAQGLIF